MNQRGLPISDTYLFIYLCSGLCHLVIVMVNLHATADDDISDCNNTGDDPFLFQHVNAPMPKANPLSYNLHVYITSLHQQLCFAFVVFF